MLVLFSHEGLESLDKLRRRNFGLLKQVTFVFRVARHNERERKVFWAFWVRHHVIHRTERKKHLLLSLLRMRVRHFHPVYGYGQYNLPRRLFHSELFQRFGLLFLDVTLKYNHVDPSFWEVLFCSGGVCFLIWCGKIFYFRSSKFPQKMVFPGQWTDLVPWMLEEKINLEERSPTRKWCEVVHHTTDSKSRTTLQKFARLLRGHEIYEF